MYLFIFLYNEKYILNMFTIYIIITFITKIVHIFTFYYTYQLSFKKKNTNFN